MITLKAAKTTHLKPLKGIRRGIVSILSTSSAYHTPVANFAMSVLIFQVWLAFFLLSTGHVQATLRMYNFTLHSAQRSPGMSNILSPRATS